MSQPARLIVLPQSPWSERARWALDHHGLAYRLSVHVPFLGERRLRRVLGNPPGRATVPILLVGGEVLSSSWEIARYADRVGRAERLIPDELEPKVRHWDALAERAMSAARPLTIKRLLDSDAALDETLPPPVPRWLRSMLRPVARFGTEWFARKYALDLADTGAARAALEVGLQALRSALGGSDYVLSRFSYADVIMATLLHGVSPVADRYVPLGPATRAAWTQPELAAAYADLIAWRDRLYERHRPPTTALPSRSAAAAAADPH
ncbi:MAG TPA: glutathione S-transferase N-terminal domain-containing protein [Polyangiaceae bacterium]|nr:glutathione S-transferase N-terminal domain-containing protein [Polyangiaceae bacterium]